LSVFMSLKQKISESPVHLTLLDPERQGAKEAVEIAANAYNGGTDGIMIGGSLGIVQKKLEETVRGIKAGVDLPVILFPGDVTGISEHADAIFFMSLLNSRNPYYITGAQAIGAPTVKKSGIEVIPMGYLIVEPGGVVGFVGDARPIPRKKPEMACAYALAAQYLGMQLIYLEAGSGVDEHVPQEMISKVSKVVDIPIVVGGGIRTGKDASKVAEAGADIIVTGTLVEETKDVEGKIREITKAIKG